MSAFTTRALLQIWALFRSVYIYLVSWGAREQGSFLLFWKQVVENTENQVCRGLERVREAGVRTHRYVHTCHFPRVIGRKIFLLVQQLYYMGQGWTPISRDLDIWDPYGVLDAFGSGQHKKKPLGIWVNHGLVTLDYLLLVSSSSHKAKSLARSKDTEIRCKSMRPLIGVDRDSNLSQIFILGSGDTQLWLVPADSWSNKS